MGSVVGIGVAIMFSEGCSDSVEVVGEGSKSSECLDTRAKGSNPRFGLDGCSDENDGRGILDVVFLGILPLLASRSGSRWVLQRVS
jgi:hypothetical protein